MVWSAIRMPRYVVPHRIQTAIHARYAVRRCAASVAGVTRTDYPTTSDVLCV